MNIIPYSVSSIIIFSCLLISGCNNGTRKGSGNSDRPDAALSQNKITLVTKEIKTESGRTFLISEYKKSASLSDILVVGKDFPARNELYKLADSDPLENIFVADLDNNGFQELYLITRSAGSGSYATITGIVSFRDKSYGMIYIPDIEPGKDQFFKGYMGHDRIYLAKGILTREFPVYKEGDTNSNPTGGNRKITYALIAGEASYILKASQFTDSK